MIKKIKLKKAGGQWHYQLDGEFYPTFHHSSYSVSEIRELEQVKRAQKDQDFKNKFNY